MLGTFAQQECSEDMGELKNSQDRKSFRSIGVIVDNVSV